jgi:putative endonuclease
MIGTARPPAPDPARPSASRLALANWGERVAEAFLVRRGATVLRRNHRVGRDELDLVIRLDGAVVVVEVKTRRRDDVDPMEAVDGRKRAALERAARTLSGLTRSPRLDVVTVVPGRDGVSVRWWQDVA